jgi:hypothetical protein
MKLPFTFFNPFAFFKRLTITIEKIDLKKMLKYLYNPSATAISVVDVPRMEFLMIDGEGNPNTTKTYHEAVEALFAVAYAAKFIVKKNAAIDYTVMPLEGLWWTDDMTHATRQSRSKLAYY